MIQRRTSTLNLSKSPIKQLEKSTPLETFLASQTQISQSKTRKSSSATFWSRKNSLNTTNVYQRRISSSTAKNDDRLLPLLRKKRNSLQLPKRRVSAPIVSSPISERSGPISVRRASMLSTPGRRKVISVPTSSVEDEQCEEPRIKGVSQSGECLRT